MLSIALLAAACSGGVGATSAPIDATTAPTDANATPSATAAAGTASSDPSAPASAAPSVDGETSAPPPVLDQPWATTELTDVATGEPFTLASLAGRTLILEPMAIWCSTCFAQQGHVYDALEQLDAERVVYVVIDVDASETPDALRAYRERHGFTGRYVVASRDMARALVDEFGDLIVNPPSAPMVVIGVDGTVTLAPFGTKSSTEIVELARAHGA